MYFGYKISDDHLERVQRICIIAWGLIGDVLIRVPVIEAVRKRFPDAEITVVTESITRPVFECNAAVDNIVVFNRRKKPFYQYLFYTAKNLLLLRHKKFDLCIDLYAGGSSPNVTRLTGATIRLGFDHKKKLRRSYNLLVKKPDYCRQWIKDFALLLSPLGVQEHEVRVGTSFYYSANAASEVARYSDAGKRYFCINLATSDLAKCWPVEKFVALALKIHEQYGLTAIVLTNPGQEELAQQFAGLYTAALTRPPVLPLLQVGALIDRCDYMITGDTSIMHLAFGLKKPTLVLFTYTRPEWHVVEDCVVEYCFKEDPQSPNWRCGRPWGGKDISVEEAMTKFQSLVTRVATGPSPT